MPARGNGKRSLKQRMKDKMKQLQAVRWASRSQPAQSSADHEQQNGHSLPPRQEGPTTSTPRVSASKRKLNISQNNSSDDYCASMPTTIVDLSTLQPLFSSVLCKECHSEGLSLMWNRNLSKGFSISLFTKCEHCGDMSPSILTSKKVEAYYEVNRRAVGAGLSIGIGHGQLQRFSEAMDMPGMSERAFRGHFNFIHTKCDIQKNAILSAARDRVRAVYQSDCVEAFHGDILDVAVSFDGTWGKRGYTSKTGAGAVIEVRTGLVIDYHICSLHCQLCSVNKGKMTDGEFDQWLQQHKDSGACTQNYSGTSGGMEVRCAKVLWGRSLDHSMRYTEFVSDGDAKVFQSLCELNPYGDDCAIVKEECVNHVAKRLGSGLRTLKSTLAKQKITIGGRAVGSLTDDKIGKLQAFYNKAVRSANSSVEEMSSAIWASFYHSISTDEKPQHHLCSPEWCFFLSAVAEGRPVHDIHQQRLEHRKRSTFLNSHVASHVKAVYERLTRPELLSRCLLGKTQNPNECLHSLIWSRCPKHLFAGLKRVDIATTFAVGEFNEGSRGTHTFLNAAGCFSGTLQRQMGRKRDSARINKSERAAGEVQEARRKKRKLAEQRERDYQEQLEGGPLYKSGSF
ncbi:hypothetical protein PoB_003584900 [Plakobranchus ocellatus]|uniref:Mutator-like transposase domain-containing protein n=1 Tax=Plakobranchus ocellatus TaxID=259542 RepID=A0AAV4AT92_9GAST|nr:hypothetical protein PoB_003584900 [Plakobranchus ocellatus]